MEGDDELNSLQGDLLDNLNVKLQNGPDGKADPSPCRPQNDRSERWYCRRARARPRIGQVA
jgi:hypothetical protein